MSNGLDDRTEPQESDIIFTNTSKY